MQGTNVTLAVASQFNLHAVAASLQTGIPSNIISALNIAALQLIFPRSRLHIRAFHGYSGNGSIFPAIASHLADISPFSMVRENRRGSTRQVHSTTWIRRACEEFLLRMLMFHVNRRIISLPPRRGFSNEPSLVQMSPANHAGISSVK